MTSGQYQVRQSTGEDTEKCITKITQAIPKRFIVVILATSGVVWSFCFRFNLTVAIVAMVSAAAKNKTVIQECSADTNASFVDFQEGEFDWGTYLQGIVLGSLYYGYILTSIAGGRMAERFGARRVIGYSLAANSLLSLLTAIAVRQSVYLLIALRILQGFCGGMIFPALLVVLEKWAPVKERSRMNAVTMSGIYLGIVTSQFLSGLLSDSTFLGGWPSVFYVMGAFGLVSAMLWLFFVSETPADHSTITTAEREYIENNIRAINKRKTTPWLHMCTSLPAWSIYTGHIANSWNQYAIGSFLPTYIEQVLHFNIRENGFFSALPYVVTFIFTNIGGIVSDVLLRRTEMETGTVRKIMVCLGGFGAAAFIVAAGFTGCDVTINILCLTLAIGMGGIKISGLFLNPLDIASSYAGTLFGISNTIANSLGFVAPYVTGFILGEEPTLAGWRTVFITTGAISVFGSLFFMVFASGEIQPWATAKGVRALAVIPNQAIIKDNNVNSEIGLPDVMLHRPKGTLCEIEITVDEPSEGRVNNGYIMDDNDQKAPS